MKTKNHSPIEMMKIIQRGIAGHLTYISAVGGWGTTSELALYPPIGSILLSRGWMPHCQYKLSSLERQRGAPRTIDFVAFNKETKIQTIAIEIKLLKTKHQSKKLNLDKDIKKLTQFRKENKNSDAFLLIVGRKIDFQNLEIFNNKEKLSTGICKPIVADVGKTSWGSFIARIV